MKSRKRMALLQQIESLSQQTLQSSYESEDFAKLHSSLVSQDRLSRQHTTLNLNLCAYRCTLSGLKCAFAKEDSDLAESCGNREPVSSAEEHDFLKGIGRQYRGSRPHKNGNKNIGGGTRTR